VIVMHRSRLYAVLIDTPEAETAQAAAFWAAALGASALPDPGQPQFITLHDGSPGLVASIQAVDDAPRFHLDIETDDVEAETARLVGLGAIQVARWLGCRTLRVPGGHLMCVVPVQSEQELFATQAKTWS